MEGRAAGGLSGGVGLAGTALLHALAIMTMLVAGRTMTSVATLPAYRVELVAAPRSGGEPDAPPAATPPAAQPAPTPAPTPVERPAPTRQPPRAAPPARTPTPSRTPPVPTRPAPSSTPAATPTRTPATAAPAPGAAPGPATPNTTAAPGTGADPATIRTEGVEFPFPGYLRNLVAQVYRRWRPPGGNSDLEAEMIFFVHRDGSVTGLQFVKRSGSFSFDLEAQGAVEAAARAGAFGALPSGFGPDMLPVSFFFSPRSLQ